MVERNGCVRADGFEAAQRLRIASGGDHPPRAEQLGDLDREPARDSGRAVAPLKPAGDALLLDNSGQTVEESVAQVLIWWGEKQPFGAS